MLILLSFKITIARNPLKKYVLTKFIRFMKPNKRLQPGAKELRVNGALINGRPVLKVFD